jgi:hypothetical protein
LEFFPSSLHIWSSSCMLDSSLCLLLFSNGFGRPINCLHMSIFLNKDDLRHTLRL